MRLWSLHPKYLDTKGLVAVWREGLLAKKVLLGKTNGYASHPQLIRFRKHQDSKKAISAYLYYVWEEADKRGYCFDKRKIGNFSKRIRIKITKGQLLFEIRHLKMKVKRRNSQHFKEMHQVKKPEPHPIFREINGPIENWEVVK
jgi:nucleosome binding factor SPN SPT16 subunit